MAIARVRELERLSRSTRRAPKVTLHRQTIRGDEWPTKTDDAEN
jgi:hypothetical protein